MFFFLLFIFFFSCDRRKALLVMRTNFYIYIFLLFFPNIYTLRPDPAPQNRVTWISGWQCEWKSLQDPHTPSVVVHGL